MPKLTIANRVKRITALLKIVKLEISIKNDNGNVNFKITKSNRKNQKGFSYTPNKLKFVDIFTNRNNFEYNWAHYACHEIAHHIVSAKRRRSKGDYGLTINFNKSKKFAHFEECKVTAINNYFLLKFKYIKYDHVFFNMKGHIKGNENKLKEWWESEGKILAKTYFNLV